MSFCSSVNKVLLPEDTFLPEMNVRQLEFAYSAYVSFTKNKDRIPKFK